MYTDLGQQLSDQLWKETLDELQFAKVRSVLESIGSTEGKD